MRTEHSSCVITIDGPAGAGKSTVAKNLARELQYSYLDTGAMYRALTLKAIRTGCDLTDETALVRCAQATAIELRCVPALGLRVFLDGEDVSEDVRTAVVTNNTFYIARAPAVREILVGWQRKMGRSQNVVVEGRDVGTVVFPEATFKFYLDADFEERVQRRFKELADKGVHVDGARLRAELQERDQKDLSRAVGPLRRADDAVVIDSTRLSIDAVVEKMLGIIRSWQAV
ncbi:MAG TPA: (d)CMP kinase [Candidatus Omnitrophota bacterium]|nr:(d)CMP kinase [Candidatus Omnitrophota bacterium]HPN55549.1 (d)CMP kinase [Candidatus Omnitrophota bacterium]